MLEPQSPLLIVLLLAASIGLLVWLVRTRHLALRLVAGTLALLPPMLIGPALVNDHFDYYSNWTDLWNDLTGKAPADLTKIAALAAESPQAMREMLARSGAGQRPRTYGMLFNLPIPGTQAGITRTGLVYLPPQYFQPGYANHQFPVVEMLHGTPGSPSTWELGVHAPSLFRALLQKRQTPPAVLVMPDINGGRNYSSQCLNVPGGPQNETYLTDDVPRYIASRLRVQPPGFHWALMGFSEGGYCAANLSLRAPAQYGVVGILSGYFTPLKNSGPAGPYDPFHGNQVQRTQNTPLAILRSHAFVGTLPRYWLGVGGSQSDDMAQARAFTEALRPYQPNPPVMVVKGAGHSFTVWRQAFPAFIRWAGPPT